MGKTEFASLAPLFGIWMCAMLCTWSDFLLCGGNQRLERVFVLKQCFLGRNTQCLRIPSLMKTVVLQLLAPTAVYLSKWFLFCLVFVHILWVLLGSKLQIATKKRTLEGSCTHTDRIYIKRCQSSIEAELTACRTDLKSDSFCLIRLLEEEDSWFKRWLTPSVHLDSLMHIPSAVHLH